MISFPKRKKDVAYKFSGDETLDNEDISQILGWSISCFVCVFYIPLWFLLFPCSRKIRQSQETWPKYSINFVSHQHALGLMSRRQSSYFDYLSNMRGGDRIWISLSQDTVNQFLRRKQCIFNIRWRKAKEHYVWLSRSRSVVLNLLIHRPHIVQSHHDFSSYS